MTACSLGNILANSYQNRLMYIQSSVVFLSPKRRLLPSCILKNDVFQHETFRMAILIRV